MLRYMISIMIKLIIVGEIVRLKLSDFITESNSIIVFIYIQMLV